MIIDLNTIYPKQKRWVRTDEFRINCVFCNDQKYHLYINISKKVFHCFKCNMSGVITDNLQLFNFISIKSINNSNSNELILNKEELNEEVISYLKNRINNNNIILKLRPFLLKNYSDYIFFDYSNEGLIGRRYKNFENDYVKYLVIKNLNAPYGFSKLKKRKRIFIVEGIFDMIPFLEMDENVVCLAGKNLPLKFYTLLESTKQELYLVLDGDAHKDINKYIKLYNNIKPVYLPYNEDPFTLGKNVFSFIK